MDTRHRSQTRFVRTAHLRAALLAAAFLVTVGTSVTQPTRAASLTRAPVGAAAAVTAPAEPRPFDSPFLLPPLSTGVGSTPALAPNALPAPVLVAPGCPACKPRLPAGPADARMPVLVAPGSCGKGGCMNGTGGFDLIPATALYPLPAPVLVAPGACGKGGGCRLGEQRFDTMPAFAPDLHPAATSRGPACGPWPAPSSVASPKTSDGDSSRCLFEVEGQLGGRAMLIAGGEPPVVVDSCAMRRCQA